MKRICKFYITFYRLVIDTKKKNYLSDKGDLTDNSKDLVNGEVEIIDIHSRNNIITQTKKGKFKIFKF
jgi:hypothetical protein